MSYFLFGERYGLEFFSFCLHMAIISALLAPMNYLCTFVKNQKSILYGFISSFSTFSSAPLISLLISAPVPLCLDYYSFRISLEISYCLSSNFVFFQVVLACIVHFHFSMSFRKSAYKFL